LTKLTCFIHKACTVSHHPKFDTPRGLNFDPHKQMTYLSGILNKLTLFFNIQQSTFKRPDEYVICVDRS